MKGLNNYQESNVILLNTGGILITNSTFELTLAIRRAIKLAFIYETIHIAGWDAIKTDVGHTTKKRFCEFTELLCDFMSRFYIRTK